MGEWRYSSTILDLGRLASRPSRFTPGKELPYHLNRKLGGPQSRSERCGEEKGLEPAGNWILAVHPSPVPIPTGLSRLFAIYSAKVIGLHYVTVTVTLWCDERVIHPHYSTYSHIRSDSPTNRLLSTLYTYQTVQVIWYKMVELFWMIIRTNQLSPN
jgi:hypothetical protein